MKRAAPGERSDETPLRAHAAEREAAANRGELGATRAAAKADRLDAGWRSEALAIVRAYALSHEHFLAEDCGLRVPEAADPRAVGAVMQEAKRAGIVAADGFAPVNSSNRGGKVRWRSLIYVPSAAPART